LAPVFVVQAPAAGGDTARIQEFPLPLPGAGFSPTDITRGPGGDWFTDYDNQKVGRITVAGVITEFPTTGRATSITTGADGNLWFEEVTDAGQGFIGRLTPSGVLTEFPAPSVAGFLNYGAITKGPDGNVWYTDTQHGSVVGRITPSGQITEVSVPNGPTAITTGPDGNLWFGLYYTDTIGRIAPDMSGETEFPLPLPPELTFGGGVNGITAGPDGAVWYTTNFNSIGRVTMAGAVTLFRVPSSGSDPADITTGPDGNLWFTEVVGDRIGRITPQGAVREVLLPRRDSSPQGITTGPDGRLWFAEPGLGQGVPGRIGALDPSSLVAPPRPCLTVTHSMTLTHDVGPCAGDGIAVKASNLTLDLGGHKVFAAKGRRVGDFAGIHIVGVSGVTVRHGEVTGFDAGVWLDSGAHNTVTGLRIHDNLSPANEASLLGDGVALFHSASNTIADNVISHNGVFDGISVLGLGSNDNTIRHNRIDHNSDRGIANGYMGATSGLGTGIIINAFLEPDAAGRGESLSGNDVVDNDVNHNLSSGISSISNVGAHLSYNRVNDNGFHPDGSRHPDLSPGNGIGVAAGQAATQTTQNVVVGNITNGNADDGVQIISDGNTVTRNQASANGFSGIENFYGHNNTFTTNVALGNATFTAEGNIIADLVDGFSDCDSNTWADNTYGTATPECTTAGGHMIPPPPSAPLVRNAVVAPAPAAASDSSFQPFDHRAHDLGARRIGL
jgi:streptogramin lyase